MIDGALDRKDTLARVQALFQYHTLPDGYDLFAHLLHVACLAESAVAGLALPVRSAIRSEVKYDPRELAWHVGMWHHAVSHANLCYDDVLRYTNVQVADHVSLMTLDRRLPYPRQIRDFCEYVVRAPKFVQLMVLADCLSHTDELVAMARKMQYNSWRHVRRSADMLHEIVQHLRWVEGGPYAALWRWSRRVSAEITDCSYNRRKGVLDKAERSRPPFPTRDDVLALYRKDELWQRDALSSTTSSTESS